MSRLLHLLAILLTIAAAGGVGYGAVVSYRFSGARVRMESAAVELGKTFINSKASGSIQLTNVGHKELVLAVDKVSCTCTDVSLDSERLMPGETATLSVSVGTPGSPGEFSSVVSIKTNDKYTETIPIHVRGLATTLVKLSRQLINVERLGTSGLPVEMLLVVTKGELANAQTLGSMTVRTSSDFVVAKVDDSEADAFQIDVKILESAPIGVIRESLNLTFLSPAPYDLKVPIYGEILGEVTADPSSLSLGKVSRKEKFEQEIAFSGDGNSNDVMEVVASSPKSPYIQVNVLEGPPRSARAIVAIDFSKIGPHTILEENLRFAIKVGASTQVLSVPVLALVE